MSSSPPHRSLTVSPRAAGMRLDVYLSARFEGLSRSAAAKAIKEGDVRSDQRTLKPSTTLRAEEVLTLSLPQLAPDTVKPDCPPLLHTDPRVLAFDKPPGLLMHPVGQAFTWGLINLAREAFPDQELHLAHRLDRETSGVCLVARDADANRHLKAAFKAREAKKTYLAVVRGAPAWDALDCEAAIGQDTRSPVRLKQGAREDGQSAMTHFEVLERGETLSLVRCTPRTGRTHQLRVHLDHLGHPIFGDKLYGQDPEVFLSIYEGRPLEDLDERLGHPRQCLHAAALSIPHPDGGLLEVRSPLPEDMTHVLANDRREEPSGGSAEAPES